MSFKGFIQNKSPGTRADLVEAFRIALWPKLWDKEIRVLVEERAARKRRYSRMNVETPLNADKEALALPPRSDIKAATSFSRSENQRTPLKRKRSLEINSPVSHKRDTPKLKPDPDAEVNSLTNQVLNSPL